MRTTTSNKTLNIYLISGNFKILKSYLKLCKTVHSAPCEFCIVTKMILRYTEPHFIGSTLVWKYRGTYDQIQGDLEYYRYITAAITEHFKR